MYVLKFGIYNLILGMPRKIIFSQHSALGEQLQIVIHRGFHHFILRLQQLLIEHLGIEMSAHFKHFLQYCKAFRRLPAAFRCQKTRKLICQ